MSEETKKAKEETKKSTEEVKKPVETKKEESKETKSSVDQLAINNKQAADIAALQAENLKIKDFIGKKSKASSSASRRNNSGSGIVGLQKLQGFGRK